MQKTGLDRIEFTYKFNIGHTKPSIRNLQNKKEVSFLDKFGDSKPIGASEG